jgi:hypothetical protein
MCICNGVLKILTNGPPQRLMSFEQNSTQKFYGPIFLREDTVTGTSDLDMLQTWLFPRLQKGEPEDFNMKKDGAPLHCRLDVRRWLNDVLPHRWIKQRAHEDLSFCAWPAPPSRFNPLLLIFGVK